MELIVISAGLNLVGAIFSLILIRHDMAAKYVACTFGLAAALCGVVAGGMGVFGPQQYLQWLSPFEFSTFSLLLDPLTGLLLLVINFLGVMAWIFGYSYFNEYRGVSLGTIGFFMNVFLFAMNLVCATDSAFWFLVFFEVMALSSYFLVTISGTEQALHGGFMYFIVAHLGFILIMIAFFIMATFAGSWSFSDFRQCDFGPVASSFVFLLAFFGFGCKAGMFPTHSWLPEAHPEAPSNVSALMSGAMVKIGIYGIVLVGVDLLQASGVQIWWGVVVLLIGATSALLGIVYGVAEKDIKKLLAYCTVENIGIILMGVGIGLIGMAMGNEIVAGLGFVAAFFHVVNHATFKGLLFLGSGCLLYSLGTRDMDEMGGLIRTMPFTALFFGIGAFAIAAVPPLNGFVSEWLTLQAMITTAAESSWWIAAVCGVAIVALAITGAVAVTAFVKAYGVSFLGKPRSEKAANAREVPFPMLLPMGLMVLCCIALAACASWLVPVFGSIAGSLGVAPQPLSENVLVLNPGMDTMVSMPILIGLVIVATFIGWALRKVFTKDGVATNRETWQTGYMPDDTMPLAAFSVAQEVKMFLRVIYVARDKVMLLKNVWNRCFKAVVDFFDKAQYAGPDLVAKPTVRFVDWMSNVVSRIECGSYRWYVLYIVIGFVVFLILACVL